MRFLDCFEVFSSSTFYLSRGSTSKFGRMIALTGARQTGKNTLVSSGFAEHAYLSLEDPVVRPDFLQGIPDREKRYA